MKGKNISNVLVTCLMLKIAPDPRLCTRTRCCCCSDPELSLEGQAQGQQTLSGAGDTSDPNSSWTHLVLRG